MKTNNNSPFNVGKLCKQTITLPLRRGGSVQPRGAAHSQTVPGDCQEGPQGSNKNENRSDKIRRLRNDL